MRNKMHTALVVVHKKLAPLVSPNALALGCATGARLVVGAVARVAAAAKAAIKHRTTRS